MSEEPSKHLTVISSEKVNRVKKLANLTANTKNYGQITLHTKRHWDPLTYVACEQALCLGERVKKSRGAWEEKGLEPADKYLGPSIHGTCCASDPDASWLWREHWHTLSLPSPCDFFTFSPNRQPVHGLLYMSATFLLYLSLRRFLPMLSPRIKILIIV